MSLAPLCIHLTVYVCMNCSLPALAHAGPAHCPKQEKKTTKKKNIKSFEKKKKKKWIHAGGFSFDREDQNAHTKNSRFRHLRRLDAK